MKTFSRPALALGAGAALVLAAPGVLSVPAAAHTAAVVSPAAASSLESSHADTILAKVNELRAAYGLAPLTRYVELDAVAQDWSETMSRTGTFEHRAGFGAYPAGWGVAAENIASSYGVSDSDAGLQLFEQWRKSPGHLENMLRPDINSIGIGVSYNASNGWWYGTQNFASYRDPAAAGLTPTQAGSTSGGGAPAGDGSGAVPAPADSQPGPSAPGLADTPGSSQGQNPAKPGNGSMDGSGSGQKPDTPAKPTVKPTAPARATGSATNAPSLKSDDPNVIALPPTKSSTGSPYGRPDPKVASPERSKKADGASRLPVTGVSPLVALAALGLVGAGVTVFLIRTRRRS